jgi:heat shock protein HtpX
MAGFATRVVLFIITNLAVVATVSIILSVLGVQPGSIAGLAVLSLVWGMGGALVSLQLSRWIAKRATGLTLVDGRTGREELDWVYVTVERLARQANLPMPEVGVYDSPEVNAFATGPSKSRSLVAVSTGLLRSMRRSEVEGVIGHEIAHIANGDMVTMTLLQGVINAVVIFFARVIASVISRNDERPNFIVIVALEIGLGLIGAMITAWFSRRREFRADSGGAHLAGRENMVGALRRLMENREKVDPSHQALATMKINGTRGWMLFFSTHPPLEQRIAALEQAR